MPEHTAIYTAIRTEPDAPDEVKLGAVSMASVVLDKHITDPVAREAWLLIRDAAVCPWKIGRLSTSHIVFNHDSVARMHATLERQPDGRSWMVIDLGSASGTTVHRPDGSVDRVRTNAPVGVGDILHFGECTLELVR